MKPTPNKLLTGLILAAAMGAATVHADYDGGRIVNGSNTVEGIPQYDGTIVINYSEDNGGDESARHGGIEFSGGGTADKELTIRGDISISAGRDFENNIDDKHLNDGILIDEGVENVTLNISTVSATDGIRIDTYGRQSAAVYNRSTTSAMYIDVSSSDTGLVIEQHNRGVWGSGLVSKGIIEIKGNVTMSFNAFDATGIYGVEGEGRISISGNAVINGGEGLDAVAIRSTIGSVVDIAGHMEANVVKTAIEAGGGASKVNIGGTLTASGDSNGGLRGINAGSSSEITVQGDADFKSFATGVQSGSSTVNFNSNLNITGLSDGASVGIYAAGGSSITVAKDTVIQGTIEGIKAEASQATFGGKVDINAGGGASAVGVKAGGGSSIVFDDAVTINSTGNGIRANTGATVTANERVDITGTGNIVATNDDNSKIELLKGGRIVSTSGGTAIGAWGGSVTGAGQFEIVGNMNATSLIDLSLTGKSSLTGAIIKSAEAVINLDLAGASSLYLSGHSQISSLTLGEGCAIAFDYNGGNFTDINIASLTLESGSFIFLQGDLTGLESQTLSLFSGLENGFTNNGVQVIGWSGGEMKSFDYTLNGSSFEFTGGSARVETPAFIPEPATATLGLLGLASLMLMRRRK